MQDEARKGERECERDEWLLCTYVNTLLTRCLFLERVGKQEQRQRSGKENERSETRNRDERAGDVSRQKEILK